MGGGDSEHPTINKIALSSLSAASAVFSTFPIDTIKTRLQLQVRHGIIGSSRRPSVRSVASDIWARGGALGFYSGLSPAVVRHLFYTPIRIVGYEHLRHAGGDSVLGKALSGGVSGVLAQIVASPADLIKVRMQADSGLLSQGLQPRYSSIFDALRKIIRTEGILGFWRGVLPNVQRAFLVNMGELTCYDQAKHFIIDHGICGDNIFSHTLASVASGLCATALSCPADVIKTRMMNQSAGREESSRAMYKGSYDCLVKTVKFEGTMTLWKGFLPTWARLGPWQFVFWVTYEKLRHVSGLSSF